jgi:drug/metabolite transporter (DMT)-like permease
MRYRTGITWITCLSLDAPLVAIVWQNAVSTSFSLQINWHHRVLVFLSVWLGYSADRWFDAWRHKENISQRHLFFSHYRWPLLAIWTTTLVSSFTLAINSLNTTELIFGMALTISSIAITLVVQFITLLHLRTLVKSLLTASLVTASVLLFAIPESADNRLSSASLLLATFTLNCSFIHNWDREIDQIQEQLPFDSTQNKSLMLAFSLAGVVLTIQYSNPLFAYTLSSTLLLTTIHLLRNRLHPETRRALADLSLLTPLAILL